MAAKRESVAAPVPETVAWLVYVLRSRSGPRTYVGIALDVKRRLAQHNGRLPGGAKSTRAGRPWRVAKTFGPFDTRGQAQRVEASIKRLRGLDRLRYRVDASPRASDDD